MSKNTMADGPTPVKPESTPESRLQTSPLALASGIFGSDHPLVVMCRRMQAILREQDARVAERLGERVRKQGRGGRR